MSPRYSRLPVLEAFGLVGSAGVSFLVAAAVDGRLEEAEGVVADRLEVAVTVDKPSVAVTGDSSAAVAADSMATVTVDRLAVSVAAAVVAVKKDAADTAVVDIVVAVEPHKVG